jgi:hypothetical protein
MLASAEWESCGSSVALHTRLADKSCRSSVVRNVRGVTVSAPRACLRDSKSESVLWLGTMASLAFAAERDHAYFEMMPGNNHSPARRADVAVCPRRRSEARGRGRYDRAAAKTLPSVLFGSLEVVEVVFRAGEEPASLPPGPQNRSRAASASTHNSDICGAGEPSASVDRVLSAQADTAQSSKATALTRSPLMASQRCRASSRLTGNRQSDSCDRP